MRQIFLDTETTGLHADTGDRIIEIGAIELIGRERTGREFHHYLQPDRTIDEGATKVHGITNEQLADCPRFTEVVDEFIEFVRGAQLVAHNADFDIGFLDAEIARLEDFSPGSMNEICDVFDTLAEARRRHPGSSNSLNALCARYGIDTSHRALHGALKDANLLAQLYLAMTGGQMGLFIGDQADKERPSEARPGAEAANAPGAQRLVVRRASDEELQAHEGFLKELDNACPEGSLWHRLKESQLPNIQQPQAE